MQEGPSIISLNFIGVLSPPAWILRYEDVCVNEYRHRDCLPGIILPTVLKISDIVLHRLVNFSCETTCSCGSLTWVEMRWWTYRRTCSWWCYMAVMRYFAGSYYGGYWRVLWVNKEPRRSIILGKSYLSTYPFISVEVSVKTLTNMIKCLLLIYCFQKHLFCENTQLLLDDCQ